MSSYFVFDGVRGRVEVPGYKGITGTASRSIAFWMRTTQSGQGTVCWWGDDLVGNLANEAQNRVRLIHDRIELFGRTSRARSSEVVNSGTWQHVAIVHSPTFTSGPVSNFADTKIYINGVLSTAVVREDGRTSINTPEESDVILGARPTITGGFTDFYAGDLDEFAIYQDVLLTGTITSLYNGGVPGVDLLGLPQVGALQLWYRMGDVSGDTVPSGVLYSGTLVDQSYYGRNGVTFSGISIGI